MPNQLPAQIQLGEFVFDTVQRQLIHAGTVTVLEPKVYDLLCYLLSHSERFVSLAELHQQVWAGRVVTDTAVRRTISKLRVALGDTDSENPRYLRTQMKLGYQLVCTIDDGIVEVANKPVRPRSYRRFTAYMAALLVFTFTALVAWYFAAYKADSTLFTEKPEVLLDVDGVMLNLSQSRDQRYLAFIGRLDNQQNWQLYLFDTEQGLLRKITTTFGQPRFVSFIAGDTELAVTMFNEQQKASLYRLKLDGSDHFTAVSGLTELEMLGGATAADNESILIGAVLPGSNSFYQYRVNLTSHQIEPFSYSQQRVEDALANISPDGSKIALLRRYMADNKVYLQIYNSDKALLQELHIATEDAFYRFDWLGNEQILLRINQHLELIDLTTQLRRPVQEQDGFKAEFILSDNGRYSAIQRKAKHKQFYLGQWPYQGQYDSHFQLGSVVSAVEFSQQDGVMWLTDQNDSGNWLLQRFQPDTGERSTVFSSAQRFYFVAGHNSSPWLLLRQNEQLLLLNQQSLEQRTITTSTQRVTQGIFSFDGLSVLYPVQVSGQWFVYQYQLDTGKHQQFLAGYKAVLPLANGYIAITTDNTVEQLNADFSRLRVLYTAEQLTGLNSRIFLNDRLVSLITQTTLSDYSLYTFHLDSEQRYQGQLPFADFGDEVSISPQGDRVLFSSGVSMTYQLIRGSYVDN